MNPRPLIRACTPRWARNWSRKPRKSAQYVWDRFRFLCGATVILQIREGFVVRCHPLAREFFEVFRVDPEQTAELDAFVSHCSSGMQLLDVGAHYGPFTLAALHYGGPNARVVCIEASASAANVLRHNLALNNATPRCQVLNVALAAADGYLEMLTTGPFSGDYLLTPHEERNDTQRIPALTMASALSRTNFEPTHVKIDIEGCEFDVLQSSQPLLKRLRPVVFLELHGAMIASRGTDPAQLVAALRESGYRRFEIAGVQVDESALRARQYNCRITCLP